MPKKANFSKLVGGKAKKKKAEPEAPEIKDWEDEIEKEDEQAKEQQPALEKKLEKEMNAFQAKPKKQREKASEGFDFRQVTTQIKEKAQTEPARPMPQKVVSKAKAVVEKVARKLAGVERVPTGITGLNPLVEGGFEKGSSVLIVGSAGTGKTLFGLQFLYRGAIDYKEPGIFISFEEERKSLYRHSAAFGFDFEALEKENLFKVLQYKPHQVEKLMREGGGPIRDQIRAMGAKRLVIDSITSYGLLFKDEYQRRENILDFFDLLKKWGCTSIIISELPPKVAEVKEGSVGFLTDAIISLYYSKEEDKGVRVHSCEILKMRGTKHTNKLLAIGFEKDGLTIYPEVEVF